MVVISKIDYHFLVVATGIELKFDWIKGLLKALEQDSTVCSNYSYQTVQKTHPALEELKSGNAIFTFPATPVKCAGAPQKIMYLADEVLTKVIPDASKKWLTPTYLSDLCFSIF